MKKLLSEIRRYIVLYYYVWFNKRAIITLVGLEVTYLEFNDCIKFDNSDDIYQLLGKIDDEFIFIRKK